MTSRRCRSLCVVASALAVVGVLQTVGLVLSPELSAAPVPPGLKQWETREFPIAPGVKMVFCWVPPGTAQLGSPKTEQDFLTRTEFDGKRPIWMDDENEATHGL